MAVRSETHRYVHDLERPHDTQLYEHRVDGNERHNIYSRQEPVARHFDELRFNHIAPLVPDMLNLEEADALQGMEPEMADRLRALGYLS
jgi:hypothetical protein